MYKINLMLIALIVSLLFSQNALGFQCPMSASSVLVHNQDFDMFDPFTNLFDDTYVGSAYDNLVMHYRLVNETEIFPPIVYWQFVAHVPNIWGVGTAYFCVPDTDSDGMDDGYEDEMGLDSDVDDASSDQDADGETNYDEYLQDVGSWDLDFLNNSSTNDWNNISWESSRWGSGEERYCGIGTEWICVSDGERVSP